MPTKGSASPPRFTRCSMNKHALPDGFDQLLRDFADDIMLVARGELEAEAAYYTLTGTATRLRDMARWSKRQTMREA